MTMHRIIFGDGEQPLDHVPRVDGSDSVRLADLSSILFSIEDLTKSTGDADRIIASGAPTSGSESDTTSAIVGRGTDDPRIVPLVTSAAAFAKGRTYVIVGVSGLELFTAQHIDVAGDRILAATGLTAQYEAGAIVEAVTLTAQFPAATADDADVVEDSDGGPYQVRWSYTYDSDKYRVPEIVWVTRYSIQPWMTRDELKRADPSMVSRVREGADEYGKALAVAADDAISDISATGVEPTGWRTTVTARNMLRRKALSYLYMWRLSSEDDDRATDHEKNYQGLLADVSVGKEPQNAVRVDVSKDTAPQGSSIVSGPGIIGIS